MQKKNNAFVQRLALKPTIHIISISLKLQELLKFNKLK